jgi:predicted nicotinamide N-methyase
VNAPPAAAVECAPARYAAPGGRAAVAAARQHLLRRIGARFRVVTETVRINGALQFPFTRIADPDRVLDEVAAEEDRLEKVSGRRTEGEYLRLPYWAELWDSALGVAQFLASRTSEDEGSRIEDGAEAYPPSSILYPPSSLSSLSVLDLGCGMGLTGTTAAALGARVLFADLETPPLLFARLNSLPWAGRVRTRRLDWRTDRLAERFDLIIGSDVLYERKQWDNLDPFWRAHLAPGGAVLLGEPGRPTGKAFPDWIAARGWSLRRELQPVPTQPDPIQLFLLTPRPPLRV